VFAGETVRDAVSDIALNGKRKHGLETWTGSQRNIHLDTKYVTNTVTLSRIEGKTTEQREDILFFA